MPMFGRFFERYLLPGFVFQSIIIAGGYGTGRELVEFFLQYGPLAGLLGMIVFATPTGESDRRSQLRVRPDPPDVRLLFSSSM